VTDTVKPCCPLTVIETTTFPYPDEKNGPDTAFMQPLRIESCHSTWVFDPERMRFQRILKGVEVAGLPVATGWRPYFGLRLEEQSDNFVVLLNPEGTRLLRSWRHGDGDCRWCGERHTMAVSLSDVHRSARVA
jgi:hypothetical protein